MYSYWADVTVTGKPYTSTRNYITLFPDANVAAGITPKDDHVAAARRPSCCPTETSTTRPARNLAKWSAAGQR